MTIPESITINYISPSGSTIDITQDVLYADAYFEFQAAAVPGSFHITVKDENQTHTFVAGGRIELFLGGQKMFGGILTTPTRDFFFPAVNTHIPVKSRRWSLDGVDYNTLLDKRILRNPADYTHFIPAIPTSSGNYNDQHIISTFSTYFDLDFAGGGLIDVTSKVRKENDFTRMQLTGNVSVTSGDQTVTGTGTLFLDELDSGNSLQVGSSGPIRTVKSVTDQTHLELKSTPTASASHVSGYRVSQGWTWPEQGSTMRSVLDSVVIETTIYGSKACIYWLDAGPSLNWLAIPTAADQSPWGFSDSPDPHATFPYIGWREGRVSEDGSSVVNDVFIWGGSPIGTKGKVVMANRSNAASIAAHGRWQRSEVHPGEDMYKSMDQVVARANALVSGLTSGTSPVTGAQGLVNPDQQYSLVWFAHDVPLVGGVRQHLVPGKTTSLLLWSFSQDGGVTPFSLTLPLRQVRITFPTLPSLVAEDAPPSTFVQFEGTFSLQMSDPVWWWQYLLTRRPAPQAAPIVTTDETSASYPYGSYFTGPTQETPNGSRILFSIVPTYIPGTLDIWVAGRQLARFTEWTETTPDDSSGGTFTLKVPPTTGAAMVCQCRTG